MISIKQQKSETAFCNGCRRPADISLVTCIVPGHNATPDVPIAQSLDFCHRCAEAIARRFRRVIEKTK